MAPMSSSFADTEGRITSALITFLRERTLGGAGMVIVEFT